MHVEIEVALNFIISYLYNKLPRRRVNIFGEELEKALKHKFQGHWYPDKPVKGSAFRCFKTGDTPDPVLEIAAVQSGVLSADILENLPHELSVWIDPGEVSYRVGEKGVIKILYSALNAPVLPVHDTEYCNVVAAAIEHEVSRTFNPEAQCFKPMESLSAKFGNMAMSSTGALPPPPPQPQLQAAVVAPPAMLEKYKGHMGNMGSGSDSGEDRNSNSDNSEDNSSDNSRNNNAAGEGYMMDGNNGSGGGGQGSTASTFLHRQQPPSTFTIASFAATKFGSTKLKTSSKRNNRQFSSRMSPVEFSNYIKQRTSMQQPPFLQSPNSGMMGHNLKPMMSPSRSLSPSNHSAGLSINSDPFYYHNNNNNNNHSQGGFYASQQPYLGSHQQQQQHHSHQHHHQMGFGAGLTAGGSPLATPLPSAINNPISSSISSISSASSSSASSSVSSSSLGDHLLQFGNGGPGPFGGNTSNRLSAQMYNYYAAATNEAPFMDNGFFAPLSSASIGNQLEDSVPATSLLLEDNPKFGVIGGGLSGNIIQSEQSLDGLTSNETNNNMGGTADPSSANGSPNPGENLQSNTFYSGSSGSPFPQLLVAN